MKFKLASRHSREGGNLCSIWYFTDLKA